jgi:predicted TIM-barrel fold metal-dependent hydrolase
VTAPVRVVDAHHHLWDLDRLRYPWLQGPPAPGVPRLQRNYLVPDLLADAGEVPLVASVHVEAAHDPADPVAETRWLQGVSDASGFPHAIVAAARLDTPGVADVLDAHQEHRGVRGIRHMLDRDARGEQAPTTLLDDPAWRRGYRLLADRGLVFDLQVLPSQLARAAAVVAAEDVVVVLNHGGYHVPADPDAERHWRAGLRELARCPNAYVKVSGYDTVDPTWSGFRAYLLTLLETFGPDRTMFASNFPVDGRTTTYRALVAACTEVAAELTDAQRDAFFAGTALRAYGIDI